MPEQVGHDGMQVGDDVSRRDSRSSREWWRGYCIFTLCERVGGV